MARKLRLEYEGAVYHVISRGNYRADVFGTEKTKAAFLKCLEEASVKSGWRVHAWCVMSNHYHLCFTTPQPNLVEGMRWLQATFSMRFNRLRNERGHVFQGRYKALLVEPDAAGAVCHYIHLNPVRARVRPLETVALWPWTSLRALMDKRERPAWCSPEPALAHAGGLDDTPAGRKQYLAYLGWLQEDEAGKKALQFDRLSKDWAVGARGFKKELLKEHRQLERTVKRGEAGPREISAELWVERLDAYLASVEKTRREIETGAMGAPWKVAVAAAMKTTTTASNPWLAQQLRMGSPFRLSRLVSACRADPRPYQPYVEASAKCKV
jgi:putative transposase